jgi:hypothetical protein
MGIWGKGDELRVTHQGLAGRLRHRSLAHGGVVEWVVAGVLAGAFVPEAEMK